MHRAFVIAFFAVVTAAGIDFSAYAQSADGKDRRVVVVNQRSSDMLRLYGSRTTADNWEENVLTAPIRSGGKQTINFDDGTGACTYDFRAVFKDNLQVHIWNINVCRESYWVVVDE